MKVLNRINRILNSFLSYLSGVFLILMVALTTANIVFNNTLAPINGTHELLGLFCAIVVAFALGTTHMKRENISIDILFNTFPKKLKIIFSFFSDLVCIIFFSIAAWQLMKWATTILESGEVTETLKIVYYPFMYGVALGFAILAFGFLTDLLNSFFAQEEANK